MPQADHVMAVVLAIVTGMY